MPIKKTLWGIDLAFNTFNINKTGISTYCTRTAININNKTKWTRVGNTDKSGQMKVLWDRRGIGNDGCSQSSLGEGANCRGAPEETGKIIKSGEQKRPNLTGKKVAKWKEWSTVGWQDFHSVILQGWKQKVTL